MKGWKKVQIKVLCSDIIDCVNKTAPISNIPTKYKMLRTSDIRNGFINLNNLNCVTEETYNKWSRRGFLQIGDIIFTREAPLGEVGLVRVAKNYFLGQRLVLFRANPEVCDNKFLLYALQFHDNKQAIIAKGIGATVLHLRVPECEKIEINIPDLQTQKKIGNILFTYDNLIENNQKQIKLLEEAAQRLYKEWFVDLRFPGFETTPVVDGVPEGWVYDSVDSRIELLSGYAFKSSEFSDEGKYKIVTIKNVKDGQFDSNNDSRMVEIPKKMPKYCKLSDGDVLLSLTGNVGRVCIIYGEDYLLNQRVAKLKSDTPIFTYCLFRSKDMFDKMNNLANGVAQQNLSPIKTGKIQILCPTNDLIQTFETIVQPIKDKIVLLNKQISTSIQARDRLLPKLMSGEMEI